MCFLRLKNNVYVQLHFHQTNLAWLINRECFRQLQSHLSNLEFRITIFSPRITIDVCKNFVTKKRIQDKNNQKWIMKFILTIIYSHDSRFYCRKEINEIFYHSIFVTKYIHVLNSLKDWHLQSLEVLRKNYNSW